MDKLIIRNNEQTIILVFIFYLQTYVGYRFNLWKNATNYNWEGETPLYFLISLDK
jgi:hypothetical protein